MIPDRARPRSGPSGPGDLSHWSHGDLVNVRFLDRTQQVGHCFGRYIVILTK